ncbi:TPMT family class I SAM-dependent methyltransferase [Flavobacterium sp. HXWNR69]|uniref:TPMT family class I SAM-dependent methyltransferase n=1 Tax=Flavobacterium fragile TaxID=2949085 RepID=A0ABT0TLA0_9FLAO|nr:TPMT family class I SAM-dependent methyltransferase [Flavobacterium sp. HXWNR69]MCL9771135.1 TPMT family class I SAM-dependent methyltransferase [Flavobacterium sp. HXWNR69]
MNYWEERYQKGETVWDAGAITTPLKEYINQLTDKNLRILIPGAGNGYEFDYLIENGFQNVFVVDIATTPLNNIQKRKPEYASHLIHSDFFSLETTFDLILEQTFFCALPPEMRPKYVEKMVSLLNPSGKVAGLLFDFPLTTQGPPFGGSVSEYLNLFSKKFSVKKLEKAYNSIKPRKNRELFFIFEVK